MNRILLFSGGLDSAIYWKLLNDLYLNISPIYFKIGHRYEQSELDCIERLNDSDRRLNITYVDNLKLGCVEQENNNAFIPLRNLLLCCTAVSLYDADIVYLGALKGETSTDKTNKFFRDTSRLLIYLQKKQVYLKAPYSHKTKTELVSHYLSKFNSESDIHFLKLTTSCHKIQERKDMEIQGCGQCIGCFRRFVAMKFNGIDEKYHTDPLEWNGWNLKYVLNRLSNQPLRHWKNIISMNISTYFQLNNIRRMI